MEARGFHVVLQRANAQDVDDGAEVGVFVLVSADADSRIQQGHVNGGFESI